MALDAFDRFVLTQTYGRGLAPAAAALTAAALDREHPAQALLAQQALAALGACCGGLAVWPWYDPTTNVNVIKPLELIARDLADVLVGAVLEADRPRRLRLARLLAAVAHEAAQGRAAAQAVAA